MIGKVPRPGNGFHGLVSYLMKGKKGEPNPDRVAWTTTHNLLVEDPALAPRLMRAVAKQSRRCQKPVYHLVISWSREENPTDDLMRAVGTRTITDLDLNEHQAILIAHNDTDHKHLHMVVNRVHPVTGKAWHTSNDYARVEISLRKQAEAMGLAYVPGKFNDPEAFGLKQRRVKDGEYQAAVRHGKPLPMEKFSAEEIKSRRAQLSPMFAAAKSWEELTGRLRTAGLSLKTKGQGLVITDGLGFMKLSDLGKQVRLAGLELAYGEAFDAFSARARHKPEPSFKIDIDHASFEDGDARKSPVREFAKRSNERRRLPQSDSVPPEDAAEANAQPAELSEAEKKLLREEARQRRIEERALELAARARAGAAAAAANDDSSRGRDFIPLEASSSTNLTSMEPRMADDPRSAAKAGLSTAYESFEMAQQLFKLGFIDRKGIEKASAELAYAKEEFSKHQTTQEWLQDGLRETFKPDTGASKELTAMQKREQELELQIKREKEQRDRDR